MGSNKNKMETAETPAAEGTSASTFVAEGSANEVAMALLSDDESVRATMIAKIEGELAAATAQKEAAEKRIARCSSVLASFSGAPVPSAEAASTPSTPRKPRAAAPSRGRGGPAATGDASTKEVLTAVQGAGRSGLSFGALRAACGGKKTAATVHALVESGKLFIPENQNTRGAGVVVRAK